MSGRVEASGAGERSSVLVSPLTLNTATVSEAGTSGREVNHSASAQDWMHALGVGAALVGQLLDVMEIVEHQQGLLQALGGDGADFRVGSRSISGLMLKPPSMVASSSVASLRDTSAFFSLPLATRVEEAGLETRGVVDAGGHAMGQQFDAETLPRPWADRAAGRQALGLLGRQRQRRNSKRGAFGDMGAVGFKHRHDWLFLCEQVRVARRLARLEKTQDA